MNPGKIIVTGAAGFIGFHLINRLLNEGYKIIGLDNINNYYNIDLKYSRLAELGIEKSEVVDNTLITNKNFSFIKASLEDKDTIDDLFNKNEFDVVINLAAQAGVRYSLKNPYAYIDSNIRGFFNVLEAVRFNPVSHLIYASSSSVYGANSNVPFSVQHNVDHPMSLYAATKKSNELMAHTYSNLYDIPTTGLRFFTVYGPWGRPDMAYYLFTEAILKGKPIDIYNYGEMERDFTYIDDIVEAVTRLVPKPPTPNEDWNGQNPDPATSFSPYRIFNIGNSNPVNLMDFIHEIENQLETKAEKNMKPIQPGDVPQTWADVDDLFEYINFRPHVGLKEGIPAFIEWYKKYYGVEV